MEKDLTMLQELRNILANEDEFVDLHHTFINDCLAVLTDQRAAPEEKQATLSVFMSIIRMHLKPKSKSA